MDYILGENKGVNEEKSRKGQNRWVNSIHKEKADKDFKVPVKLVS